MATLQHPQTGRSSRAASIVPVLLSLAGLFALAVGAAYTGREIVGLVAGLMSGG